MALPSCTRCGNRDPQRMHGLMTLWFGPLADLEADLGYFYLCPTCHDELVLPELERIQNRILELHPAAQRHVEEMDAEDAEDEEGEEDEEDEEDEDDAGQNQGQDGGQGEGKSEGEGEGEREVEGQAG